MMKELLNCKVALEKDLLTTIRLSTGGICSAIGIDVEESEDVKLCVTESLLLLMRRGFLNANVVFSVEEGLYVTVHGENCNREEGASDEDEISYALLGALVNDLQIEKEGENVTGVRFRCGT